MKLKICGVKDSLTLKACDDVGIDFVGFVFAKSKRQVSLEEALALKRQVPLSHAKLVAVFKDMASEEIQLIVDTLAPDMVQLYDPVSINFPERNIIRVIAYPDPLDQKSGHLLVDAPVAGSGKTFDWSHLKSASPQVKLWVAGGLHLENLPQLLSAITPYAVDISSGAETDGIKDIQKIRALAHYKMEV